MHTGVDADELVLGHLRALIPGERSRDLCGQLDDVCGEHLAHPDVRIAPIVAAGFVVGGLVGAKVAVGLSNAALAKAFGVLLLGLGLQMILR